MKNTKGITLIALVITIIVMIILVGVTLNITLDENGIISKAQKVKTKQEEVTDIETIQSVALGYITTDAKVDFNAFKNDYSGKEINGYTIDYTLGKNYATASNSKTTFYIDKNGNITKIRELGEEVTIGEESFYVLEDKGEDVVLLAKYNINIESLEQSETETEGNKIPFSADNYWENRLYPLDLNEVQYNAANMDAMTIARKYAEETIGNNAKGGLLTVDFINSNIINPGYELQGNNISKCPSWIYTSSYWLGTAEDDLMVHYVDGNDSNYGNFEENRYGVRPIVTISKSLIQ